MPRKYFGWKSYEAMREELVGSWFDYEKREYIPKKAPEDFPKKGEVLFAYYGTGDYEGSAHMVFRRDGKLFLWTGGHCSCNGLEWSKPVEVTPKALSSEGYFYRGDAADERAYKALVERLCAEEALPAAA